jgi:hypothetical protein
MRPLVSGVLCALLLTLLAFPRSVAAQQKLERGDVTVNVGTGAVIVSEPIVLSRGYGNAIGATAGVGYALYPWLELWSAGTLSRHGVNEDTYGNAIGIGVGTSDLQADPSWLGTGLAGGRLLLYPTGRLTIYTTVGFGLTYQRYGAASLIATSDIRDPQTGTVVGQVVDRLTTSSSSQTDFTFSTGLGGRANVFGRLGVFVELSYGLVFSDHEFVYQVENISITEGFEVDESPFTPPSQEDTILLIPRVLAGLSFRL